MKDYEKKVEDFYNERSAKIRALSALQGANSAGIPQRYQRIGKDDFKGLLSPNYHNDSEVDKISALVFDSTPQLMELPYILIDGGNIESRNRAAFAILFRVLVYEYTALYKGAKELVHRFNSFADIEGMSRTDYATSLKDYDMLFLGEFHRVHFNPNQEGGSFFDEVLESRYNLKRPTVITFAESMKSPIQDLRCGAYMANICIKEYADYRYINEKRDIGGDKIINPTKNVLRIRVKMGEGI